MTMGVAISVIISVSTDDICYNETGLKSRNEGVIVTERHLCKVIRHEVQIIGTCCWKGTCSTTGLQFLSVFVLFKSIV